MYDALHMDANVGVLELLDLLAAPMAMRKQRERVPRDLVQNRVVVPSGEGHRLYFRIRAGADARPAGDLPYAIAPLRRNGGWGRPR